jgi:hypothetical protein
VDAPEISWRPLGQLFVSKGLLTEERLEHALTVQVEQGGRLGEKLVELGYVSSSALAHLLAEQYGVELAFDTGFGTGLRAELERRYEKKTRPEPAPEEAPLLKLVETAAEPVLIDDGSLAPLAGLEEQWAKLAAAEARVEEMERELEEMRERLGETEGNAPKPRSRGSRNGAAA